MKNKLFILLIFSLFQFSYAQTETEIYWEKSYEQARKKAKEEKKKILIFFTGSDWCTYCKALKKDVLETPKFRELVRNTILYKADFPRAKDLVTKEQQRDNKKLRKKFNRKEKYPMLVILNKKGKLIAQKESYNLMGDPSYHFDFLMNNLN